MFNSYSSNHTSTNNIKVNAISGTLVKNYQKSFFYKFKANGQQAKLIFDADNPRMVRGKEEDWISCHGQTYYKDIVEEIVIIQCMILADDNFLAEIMWKEDFDAMFGIITEREMK